MFIFTREDWNDVNREHQEYRARVSLSISVMESAKGGTAILRVIFIELCRRVRVKFPKS